MFKQRTTGFVVIVVISVTVFIHCSTNNITGNGTLTGNPTVTGFLYESDGKTPARNAVVSIRLHTVLADTSGFGLSKRLADTATVTTDDNGMFVFDSTLDTGLYVIEANQGDTSLAWIDSVHVTDVDSTVEVEDTLKPAGSITGTIYLSEGGDPRKVFVLAFGLNRFTMPDTSGRFTFDSLAEAEYDLRIISSLDDYGVLDTFGVPVMSEQVTDLDTLRLPFTGIPTVKGLTLSYDTLKQIVTLTWNQADTSLVSGYNVYRRNVDSNTVLKQINTSPITDTIYKDSSGTQDQTYEYRVAAVDQRETEGTKSAADQIQIVSSFRLLQEIGSAGIGDGQFSSINGIAVDSSGNVFVADRIAAHPGTVRIQKFDSNGVFLKKWGGTASKDTGQFNGVRELSIYKDSLLYVTDPGNGRILVFNLQGDFQFQFNIGQSSAANQRPYSIAILDSAVYISEINGGKVFKYSIRGDSLTEWNFPEDATLSIGLLSTSAKGFVYFRQLSDTVYLYDLNGQLVKTLNIPASVTYSEGMATGGNGDMFISDLDNCLVWNVDSLGVVIGRWAVYVPSKIAVDSRGKIYVGSNNSSIQVYKR